MSRCTASVNLHFNKVLLTTKRSSMPFCSVWISSHIVSNSANKKQKTTEKGSQRWILRSRHPQPRALQSKAHSCVRQNWDKQSGEQTENKKDTEETDWPGTDRTGSDGVRTDRTAVTADTAGEPHNRDTQDRRDSWHSLDSRDKRSSVHDFHFLDWIDFDRMRISSKSLTLQDELRKNLTNQTVLDVNFQCSRASVVLNKVHCRMDGGSN